jgi:peroxiredoxin
MRQLTILLTCAAALLAGGLARGAEVPTNPADVRPLAVGSAMPAVTVRNPDGSEHLIGPGPLAKPTILIFYRGGWCPYCNRHLGVLKQVEPDLLRLGYELLFLSADRPEILYSSLKEPDIHYTLLSDAEMRASRAYHVAYRLDAEALEKYKAYGVDLEAASGQTHHELPVPAVFIIDRSGVIRFVHANPDYTTRISPDDLLAAARAVAASAPVQAGVPPPVKR